MLPYDPIHDFTAIALVGESPNVLVANLRLPAKSVKELIALAKSRPGQLNYGSPGAGSTVHLSGEIFSSMAEVKMVHVPFKGGPAALTALIGGELDLMFASLATAIPLIKADRIKAFAVTSVRRNPALPELPTIAEAGGLQGFDVVAWFGILGPAGIPQDIVSTLNHAALAAVRTPEVKGRLFAAGVEVHTGTPTEFARLIQSEVKRWAKVVKASGARVD